MDLKNLSIHDRLDLIEATITAGSGIVGGIAGLFEKIKHHAPAPAVVVPADDSTVLSRQAFTDAMVQQAKDFGYAIEELRTQLKEVQRVNNEIVSALEAMSKLNAPQE